MEKILLIIIGACLGAVPSAIISMNILYSFKPKTPQFVAAKAGVGYTWSDAEWIGEKINDKTWEGGGYIIVPKDTGGDEAGAQISVSQCTHITGNKFKCSWGRPPMTENVRALIYSKPIAQR